MTFEHDGRGVADNVGSILPESDRKTDNCGLRIDPARPCRKFASVANGVEGSRNRSRLGKVLRTDRSSGCDYSVGNKARVNRFLLLYSLSQCGFISPARRSLFRFFHSGAPPFETVQRIAARRICGNRIEGIHDVPSTRVRSCAATRICSRTVS